MSTFGRYCCKSPKSTGDNFPAIRRSDRRPPICVVSITLPRSPVSLSSGDEVPPHLYTKVASTARRIFDHQCKKTFATQSGTDAKYHDVSYDGRYGGMSGPDADIVELVLMTPSGCHQLWG